MADVNTGGGEEKKGKPKKMTLRVDFTPMVDMNMLLITFFMFCTTLSKPQMMDLVMPTKDKPGEELPDDQKNMVADDKTITVILAEKDEVYYYFGKPNYTDYTSLVKTNYAPTGFRAMLVQRNGKVIEKMAELRKEKAAKTLSDSVFKAQASELKNAKDGLVVIIKPTEGSTYKNLVDVLDEMQICSIGKYAIVDMSDADNFLINNYLQKGTLSGSAPKQ